MRLIAFFTVLACALAWAEADELDAGTADAGSVDAGLPTPPAKSPQRWLTGDGGAITDAGATDVVIVDKGGRVVVRFGAPAIMSRCDADFVHLEADLEALTFVGDAVGKTQCGFWLVDARRSSEFGARPFPDRLVDVIVR